MNTIQYIKGREVLDSRGNPTVEVDVILKSGHFGRMMVPSGASTGRFEAFELRDGDKSRFRGKGVLQAVHHVNRELSELLVGKDGSDQRALDQMMIDLDGTENKSRLGANAILGISFATAHAYAASVGKPLYLYLAERYLGDISSLQMPLPMVNILSGGLHAAKNIDLQDFLIMPTGAKNYQQALEMISSVYWTMKDILQERNLNSLLADEGGFGPALPSNKAALDLLCEAIEKAGFRLKDDISIALDVAASHFYDGDNGHYVLQSENRTMTSVEMIDMFSNWIEQYPIISIEDGLAEEDWDGWIELTSRLGNKVNLVGDDLFTTNPERIQKGVQLNAGNAVLIKNNQIGTLTETVQAVQLTHEAGMTSVISARSGETEDATLADLAVGLQGKQIKIGSLATSSRLAKYNQLKRIDEALHSPGWV